MPNDIKYVCEGKGEIILFLHGWGQNKEMMLPLINELRFRYQCVVLDLPGFGESNFNEAINIKEYVQNIRAFLKEKNLLPKYIVGHSFGGKLAVEYCLQYKDLEKLAIIASPILKPKRGLKYYYKVYKYKLLKKIKKNKEIKGGSKDYNECNWKMKRFFVNVVNTHYDKSVKNIDIPVLMLWGDKDEKVNVNNAKKLNKLIENSNLYVMRGRHFAYLENVEFTKLVIQKFLRR